MHDKAMKLPDASDFTDELDPGPEDGTGLQRDMLVDARVDVQDFRARLDTMHVYADAILDDRGLLPKEAAEELTSMQSTCMELSRWLKDVENELDDRIEAVEVEG